jgi:hypothetical protein
MSIDRFFRRRKNIESGNQNQFESEIKSQVLRIEGEIQDLQSEFSKIKDRIENLFSGKEIKGFIEQCFDLIENYKGLIQRFQQENSQISEDQKSELEYIKQSIINLIKDVNFIIMKYLIMQNTLFIDKIKALLELKLRGENNRIQRIIRDIENNIRSLLTSFLRNLFQDEESYKKFLGVVFGRQLDIKEISHILYISYIYDFLFDNNYFKDGKFIQDIELRSMSDRISLNLKELLTEIENIKKYLSIINKISIRFVRSIIFYKINKDIQKILNTLQQLKDEIEKIDKYLNGYDYYKGQLIGEIERIEGSIEEFKKNL